MSKFVDRLARVAHINNGHPPTSISEYAKPWDELSERQKDAYRGIIRAVLFEAREPTEEMEIAAGRDHCSDDHYEPRETWKLMIDKALE